MGGLRRRWTEFVAWRLLVGCRRGGRRYKGAAISRLFCAELAGWRAFTEWTSARMRVEYASPREEIQDECGRGESCGAEGTAS